MLYNSIYYITPYVIFNKLFTLYTYMNIFSFICLYTYYIDIISFVVFEPIESMKNGSGDNDDDDLVPIVFQRVYNIHIFHHFLLIILIINTNKLLNLTIK